MRRKPATALSTIDLRRRRLLQTLGIGGAAAGLGGLPWLTAPGALAGEPRHGGTLRVALPQAATINPLRMSAGGAIAVVQQVAEYLVRVDEHLNLQPALATDWETPDEGRTWVFRLREGVKFNDGRPLEADDVVASFRRLVDPDVASVARSQLDFLPPEGISADDRHTVRFELSRPIGAFPYYTQIYNAVILPRDHDGDLASNPVGTGPFLLTHYQAREEAVLERNPDYWDAPRPYLDRVRMAMYDGDQPQVLALRGNAADMMLFASYMNARPLLDNEEINLLSARSTQHRQLAMRCDQPPFEDVRLRRAVALALGRESMVNNLIGGYGEPGNDHPVAPLYPDAADIDLARREPDLERAQALLAEAGVPNGFQIDLHIGRLAELPQYGVLVERMLNPIGIRVNLRVEPLNTYYEHWTKVNFGLTDWVGRAVPEQILAAAFRGGADWNAPHWRDDEFDAALSELEAATDPARRRQLTATLAGKLHEEVPAAITYFTQALRPVRRRVQGLRADNANYLDLTRAWLA
ncbi:ABC transporter substrate-binding protein [Alkalilimnicola ehrlichii MLHE-1]|uniref:Extracellular solute-binding protein, family 5 n=1 Tax=Alkalilimnicola ehrlichii (strain ATCC BAA-1101 / DSM 17681 / MLHE-1) TaxID=187272 RepID=Q0A9P9_ALKEH|nr:ABC transporter substrate-binding protein [Alkalilimnicola ehrlichii]ABI56438.1 extracellular solute-binding protein, family 5 [Alkalilimnicola ehrlichii MLHE-1]